jgi:hypothetical protein
MTLRRRILGASRSSGDTLEEDAVHERRFAMKRRTPKKLTLNRETLVHLDLLRLAGVAGGGTCNASGSCPPPSTQACSDGTCPTDPVIC